MKKIKVIKVESEAIVFDNGVTLTSDHDQDCCENHYLDFEHITLSDFENLEFNLEETFFERIPDYGIALKPIHGHSVKVPGYGYNNGYYSDNLKLILNDNKGNTFKSFDITDCQVIND